MVYVSQTSEQRKWSCFLTIKTLRNQSKLSLAADSGLVSPFLEEEVINVISANSRTNMETTNQTSLAWDPTNLQGQLGQTNLHVIVKKKSESLSAW